MEKNAEDMLGPWRWKECEIRQKVVKGRRLNRVLSVGHPELQLPERPSLRRVSAPPPGSGDEESADSDDQATGRPEGASRRGKRKATAKRGSSRKRARESSPTMSSASDSEEAPEEQAGEVPTEEAASAGAAPARVIPEPTPPSIVFRPRADGSGEAEPHLASV